MTERITRFLAERQPETPCLVVDLTVVEKSYREMAAHLPLASIYYAVKANPLPEIIATLHRLGSRFDTASMGEIELCLAQGVPPERISYGNTIKKERDIARAYALGVRLYAFDSEAELDKLARLAPGSQVFCRLLVDSEGAEWPLNYKFGCDHAMALTLMKKARAQGLDPSGFSFHVGSQQSDPAQWQKAIATVSTLFAALAQEGIELRMINLGGGFPSRYRSDIKAFSIYADVIMAAVTAAFGNRLPDILIEPGRALVAEAGIVQSEVVLISQKAQNDRRWVYLDVGRFTGLFETIGDAIKYALRTERDASARGPVTLAGPTCDSADILYEHTDYDLPLDLAIGDKVQILSAGAYTSTYSTVGFNGFAPLKTYCV
ncbi:MAG TPA: type III PLP-dependent enzyme [Dongiaceae bacterium]|jgi:ornithine decarboxylase|nr:type III PLP-dependent enzyme [Dongiaceae bacterium]